MREAATVRRVARPADLVVWAFLLCLLGGCSAWRGQRRMPEGSGGVASPPRPSTPAGPSDLVPGEFPTPPTGITIDPRQGPVAVAGRPSSTVAVPAGDPGRPVGIARGAGLEGGVPPSTEAPDRFLLPPLMDVVVEDEWDLHPDPAASRAEVERRRAQADIRRPGPDTANFPNAAYTLPKGRAYLETSPLVFYGPTDQTAPQYNWEFLLRYGLTDNFELRLFSNGFTAVQGRRETTGFAPLAFNLKVNLWEENRDYFLPAFGLEVYLQTDLGTSSLSTGTQPSINLLFDHTLPGEIQLEYNFSVSGVEIVPELSDYVFGFQWSLQRHVTERFALFTHGFYNAAALPRLNLVGDLPVSDVPTAVVVGAGGLWDLSDRLAVFGSYNAGLTRGSPTTIAFLGFAYAF